MTPKMFSQVTIKMIIAKTPRIVGQVTIKMIMIMSTGQQL